jgi:hypothetical protein
MNPNLFQKLLLSLSLFCFTIVAQAQTPCTLTCPSNIVVAADPNQCGAVVNYPAATTSGDCGNVTYSKASGSFFNVGTTTVTATAAGKSCQFTVTVNDTQAPVISSLSASPNKLWPPNHKMVDVAVRYTSTDNCSVVSCQTSVTSNEPQNGLGDGDTDVDFEVVNNNLVRLRAERSGTGTGRVYTITVTCRDAAGNQTNSSTTVTVPHDQSDDKVDKPNNKEDKSKEKLKNKKLKKDRNK